MPFAVFVKNISTSFKSKIILMATDHSNFKNVQKKKEKKRGQRKLG
jgi:UDP-N-acetyl-D-mannosaminuronate dehydrogenase